MSEVKLDNVCVAYDGKPAVVDVSLQIAGGASLALLGPSGSGKSSLLRAIAGLVPMQSGLVKLGGRPQVGVPTYRRKIGLMFQNHALFPHLNVAGNVAFGLRMAGMPRVGRATVVAEMLALVGLADRAEAAVGELSGGEQQRVALARTLAPQPQVVLLDEPLGSLDRVLRAELLDTMKHAFSQTGATSVLVTHDQSEAFALGGEVGIMRAGRLVQIGSQAEVWDAPADAWTARFLGLKNVLSFDQFPVGFWSGLPQSDSVLRPELLKLLPGHTPATSSGEWRLAGEVIAVDFRAGLRSVFVRCVGETAPLDLEVFVLTGHPKPGDLVTVVVGQDAVAGLGASGAAS